MIKWLKREKIAPLNLSRGDSVVLSSDNKEVMRATIDKTCMLDTAGIFEFDDEFDMKEGIGGVFGRDKS
jgi:hypothetical protein